MPSDRIRTDAMIGFGERLLLLTGGATAIAIGAVMTSSGHVDVGIGDLVSSGVVTGLSLLFLSLVVAIWYETDERRADP